MQFANKVYFHVYIKKATNDGENSNHYAEDREWLNPQKDVQNFRKRLQAYMEKARGHFEHFI